MAWPNRESAEDFRRKDASEEVYFEDVWPSQTAGKGNPADNNTKTGAAQGKASFIRKVYCQNCGYPADMNANDHSGGSLDASGAGGAIAISTYSGTLANGTVHTENAGTQAYRKGAGCPLCFSKNFSKVKVDVSTQNPWERIPTVGF